jgi:hypothetical protein
MSHQRTSLSYQGASETNVEVIGCQCEPHEKKIGKKSRKRGKEKAGLPLYKRVRPYCHQKDAKRLQKTTTSAAFALAGGKIR